MARLLFAHNGDEVEIEDGGAVAEACEEAGVPFACTEGVCGTCVIEVEVEAGGELSDPTQEEKDFLGEDTCCERLACQCKIRRGKVKIRF